MALNDLDPSSVGRGAVVGTVIILPAALVSRVLADGSGDGTSSPLVFVFFVVILAGFVLAGWVAGTRPASERLPVQHGAAAAALAYAVVQAIGIVSAIASGNDLSIVSIVANLLLAASCGSVGGLLAARAIDRRLRGPS